MAKKVGRIMNEEKAAKMRQLLEVRVKHIFLDSSVLFKPPNDRLFTKVYIPFYNYITVFFV